MKRKLGLAAAAVALAMMFMGCQQPHEHLWDSGTVTKEPTCTDKGVKTFKCTDAECGEERTEDIAAKGHSYDWIITNPINHWKECSSCGNKIEESNHSFGDWTITDDSHWQECECGRKIDESKHSFGDWITTEVKHWKECDVCGGKIAETDHSFAWGTPDSSTHWKECECGKKVEKAEHNFMHKGNCWQECECGEKISVSLDTLGTYDSIKKTFGVYPQTVKADTVTVDKSVKNPEITGADYYLGSDGAWYAECIENAYSTGEQYKYSNGNQVAQKSSNSVKYFKVEPIEWVYLAETKCLHAKKILTADVQWHASSNNYANSNIRSWLNGTFYDSAFTESQKKKIKTTTVDNSWASTTDAGNHVPQAIKFACEDTQDKIFLLSEKEATTTGNGFTAYNDDAVSRIRFPTDYALANYCYKYFYKDSNSSYGGWWWLRSPGSNYSFYALAIYYWGAAGQYNNVSFEYGGVVPALSIDE